MKKSIIAAMLFASSAVLASDGVDGQKFIDLCRSMADRSIDSGENAEAIRSVMVTLQDHAGIPVTHNGSYVAAHAIVREKYVSVCLAGFASEATRRLWQ